MGDMAEEYRALKEHKKLKKEAMKVGNIAFLDVVGIPYESKNNGLHIIISRSGVVIDFYPSTGKWIDRDKGKGYGTNSLREHYIYRAQEKEQQKDKHE